MAQFGQPGLQRQAQQAKQTEVLVGSSMHIGVMDTETNVPNSEDAL